MPRIRHFPASQAEAAVPARVRGTATSRVEPVVRLAGVPSAQPAVVPAPQAAKVPPNVDATRLAVRALHRRAAEARSSLPAFYAMVARHETTKAELQPAPHQRVQFKFVVDHPQCVNRQPIGTGKTFGMAFTALWLLGQDPTQRGAIVSKTQGQAAKVLHMLADYLVEPSLSAPVTLVYPWLQRSPRVGDAWTQTAITIQRPAGIRDPSVVAVGIDGAIGGARLSWVVGDDILDADNTLTTQAREKVHSNFDARILSRLDPTGSRAVVTNTPWNREDLTFALENAGWPTLCMDIYGDIWFANVSQSWIDECNELRPSKLRDGRFRLVAHDPDPDEEKPLWPERFDSETISKIRAMRLPHEFARLFLCQPFDEKAARCQRAWIENCKDPALSLVVQYTGTNPVYTGVDIGVGQRQKNDATALFTFELNEDGTRSILDIESGRWEGPTIADKVISKYDNYGSMIAVESVAAQDFIRQFAQAKRPDIRIRAHTTNKATKHNLDFGVESVFTELRNGIWKIPCARDGTLAREVQAWAEECLYYQPPPAHTGDRLMASWIAREAARRGGGGRDPKPTISLELSMAKGGGF